MLSVGQYGLPNDANKKRKSGLILHVLLWANGQYANRAAGKIPGPPNRACGQATVTLTGLHADSAQARAVLMRVSALLQGFVIRAAEQLNPQSVWQHVCAHLKLTSAGVGPPIQPT